MKVLNWAVLFGAMLVPVVPGFARAQDEPAPAEGKPDEAPQPTVEATPPKDLPPVAATVDGSPIFVSEVEKAYELLHKNGRVRGIPPEDVKAGLLNELVDRRLAVHALLRDPTLLREGEVDKQMQVLAADAQKKGLSLEDYCKANGITADTFRNDVIWRTAAVRYLDRNLADELEAYFEAHRPEFDGTEIRASHIMFRPIRHDESTKEIQARAAKIREEIESGKIDFATAAKKYSYGPSREQGGDLGFIPRHEVMLEEFSAALFKLKPGEISPPVTTALGTHLIKATEKKPGSKQWTQMIPEVKEVAAKDKLAKLSDAERETAKIEFTGKVPHYEPGTKTVATP